MAIAGIVVNVTAAGQSQACEALRRVPGIVDVRALEDGCRLAAVLEAPSQRLQDDLEAVNDLEHVLQVDVAYINYEEDLDDSGHMACPPNGGRRRHHRDCCVPESMTE